MPTLTTRLADTATNVESTEAEVAQRRAWWSLLLYPVAVVASLLIGGGLFSLLDDNVGNPAIWVVLATVPGFLVAALVRIDPGFGRKAS